ncbi:hypothetical protein [Niabella aurantiaca]|uniref:hypothetical protein n=1 Tax=Niabella aurantiaca TaxID=379900 RepID=UPI00036B0A12|nr:hypothetical protein [Niabella aurantiaca]
MITNISKITICATPQWIWKALRLPGLVKKQYGNGPVTEWKPGSPIRFAAKWLKQVFGQRGTRSLPPGHAGTAPKAERPFYWPLKK